MNRELRARAADAERSEIDAQLIGRFTGFGKGLRFEDATDAHVDALEVREIDGGCLAQYA